MLLNRKTISRGLYKAQTPRKRAKRTGARAKSTNFVETKHRYLTSRTKDDMVTQEEPDDGPSFSFQEAMMASYLPKTKIPDTVKKRPKFIEKLSFAYLANDLLLERNMKRDPFCEDENTDTDASITSNWKRLKSSYTWALESDLFENLRKEVNDIEITGADSLMTSNWNRLKDSYKSALESDLLQNLKKEDNTADIPGADSLMTSNWNQLLKNSYKSALESELLQNVKKEGPQNNEENKPEHTDENMNLISFDSRLASSFNHDPLETRPETLVVGGDKELTSAFEDIYSNSKINKEYEELHNSDQELELVEDNKEYTCFESAGLEEQVYGMETFLPLNKVEQLSFTNVSERQDQQKMVDNGSSNSSTYERLSSHIEQQRDHFGTAEAKLDEQNEVQRVSKTAHLHWSLLNLSNSKLSDTRKKINFEDKLTKKDCCYQTPNKPIESSHHSNIDIRNEVLPSQKANTITHSLYAYPDSTTDDTAKHTLKSDTNGEENLLDKRIMEKKDVHEVDEVQESSSIHMTDIKLASEMEAPYEEMNETEKHPFNTTKSQETQNLVNEAEEGAQTKQNKDNIKFAKRLEQSTEVYGQSSPASISQESYCQRHKTDKQYLDDILRKEVASALYERQSNQDEINNGECVHLNREDEITDVTDEELDDKNRSPSIPNVLFLVMEHLDNEGKERDNGNEEGDQPCNLSFGSTDSLFWETTSSSPGTAAGKLTVTSSSYEECDKSYKQLGDFEESNKEESNFEENISLLSAVPAGIFDDDSDEQWYIANNQDSDTRNLKENENGKSENKEADYFESVYTSDLKREKGKNTNIIGNSDSTFEEASVLKTEEASIIDIEIEEILDKVLNTVCYALETTLPKTKTVEIRNPEISSDVKDGASSKTHEHNVERSHENLVCERRGLEKETQSIETMETLEKLENNLKRKEEDLRVMKELLENSREDYEELQRSFDSFNKEFEQVEENRTLVSKLTLENNALKNEQINLLQEIQQLDKKNEQLARYIQEYQDQIKELEQQLGVLKSERFSQNTEVKESNGRAISGATALNDEDNSDTSLDSGVKSNKEGIFLDENLKVILSTKNMEASSSSFPKERIDLQAKNESAGKRNEISENNSKGHELEDKETNTEVDLFNVEVLEALKDIEEDIFNLKEIMSAKDSVSPFIFYRRNLSSPFDERKPMEAIPEELLEENTSKNCSDSNQIAVCFKNLYKAIKGELQEITKAVAETNNCGKRSKQLESEDKVKSAGANEKLTEANNALKAWLEDKEQRCRSLEAMIISTTRHNENMSSHLDIVEEQVSMNNRHYS